MFQQNCFLPAFLHPLSQVCCPEIGIGIPYDEVDKDQDQYDVQEYSCEIKEYIPCVNGSQCMVGSQCGIKGKINSKSF